MPVGADAGVAAPGAAALAAAAAALPVLRHGYSLADARLVQRGDIVRLLDAEGGGGTVLVSRGLLAQSPGGQGQEEWRAVEPLMLTVADIVRIANAGGARSSGGEALNSRSLGVALGDVLGPVSRDRRQASWQRRGTGSGSGTGDTVYPLLRLKDFKDWAAGQGLDWRG